MAALVAEHGPWNAYNIEVAPGIFTAPERAAAHFRLRRSVQVIADMAGKPWKQLRIADLGSLEGIFALEFAKYGAQVVGIEGREANNARARFAADHLGLSNVEFYTDDARNLAKYGRFDVVFCSGLLYHLGIEGCGFVKTMYDVCDRMVIIDTHVGLSRKAVAEWNGHIYEGATAPEHAAGDSDATKAARTWASVDNDTSFWITEASLINLMRDVGFSSTYEVLGPRGFSDFSDRHMFVALKGRKQKIHLSPELAFTPDPDAPEFNALLPHASQFSKRGYLWERFKRKVRLLAK